MRACFLFLYICRLIMKFFCHEKTHLYHADAGLDMHHASGPSGRPRDRKTLGTVLREGQFRVYTSELRLEFGLYRFFQQGGGLLLCL